MARFASKLASFAIETGSTSQYYELMKKQVALVTGASSGMGKEIARRLIQDGMTVYVAARTTSKLEELVKLGGRAIQLDVSKETEIRSAVEQIHSETGGVDVLVNNAGFGLYGPIEEINLSDARYQMDVNLFGPALLTQLLLPSMREKGTGTIVNISSMGGKVYTVLGAWYHASKHAIEGWSDCLRLEVKQFGIRVVVIEPGLIETGFGDVAGHNLQKHLRGPYSKIAAAATKSTSDAYGHGRGTPPSVIANIVSKAVASPRPKTRYVAGKYAKPMMFIRKWLGDTVFDRVITSQMR